jgi:Tfp pilus assembly protein PilV
MLEAVVAVMVFTLVGVGGLGGLSTVHISGAETESQSIAENLGRNQMENVFSLPYQDPPSTYPSLATPPGYSVLAEAEEYVVGDPAIEKVVVTVSHDSQQVLVLETLRVRD